MLDTLIDSILSLMCDFAAVTANKDTHNSNKMCCWWFDMFCLKSTESEISSDEYNEFLQQYKEFTEWLEQIQLTVRQQAASRSENYLTHVSTNV